MRIGKDGQSNRRIVNFSGSCYLVNGKSGNAVHEDVVFVTPIELVFFLPGLIGSSMHTEFTVFIRFWLVIRFEFIGCKGFRIVLRGICRNWSRVQTDKRGIHNAFTSKKQYLRFHDARKQVMAKIFKEAVKSPIRRQGTGYIKTAVMGNEKVVVQVIDKVGNHGKTFAFHNNKGTNHGMVRKAFSSCVCIFRNRRKVKV